MIPQDQNAYTKDTSDFSISRTYNKQSYSMKRNSNIDIRNRSFHGQKESSLNQRKASSIYYDDNTGDYGRRVPSNKGSTMNIRDQSHFRNQSQNENNHMSSQYNQQQQQLQTINMDSNQRQFIQKNLLSLRKNIGHPTQYGGNQKRFDNTSSNFYENKSFMKNSLKQDSMLIDNENHVQSQYVQESLINNQKNNRSKTQVNNKNSSQQLCSLMLDNVLKVPQCNRPDRNLIKQLLIQQKQVNNIFNEKLSFKKAQRNQQQKQNYHFNGGQQLYAQPQIHQSVMGTIPIQHIQHRRVSEQSLIMTQNSHQLIELSQSLETQAHQRLSMIKMKQEQFATREMWNVPNLSRNTNADTSAIQVKHHYNVSSIPSQDYSKSLMINEEEFLDIQKANIQVKEAMIKFKGGKYHIRPPFNQDEMSGAQKSKTSRVRNHSYNMSVLQTEYDHDKGQQINQDNQNSFLNNQTDTSLLQEETQNLELKTIELEKSQIEGLNQQHMQIKITKPRTANNNVRKRRDLSDHINNSSIYNNPYVSSNVYENLGMLDKTLSKYNNNNINNSKISVFMHLAQPSYNMLSTERQQQVSTHDLVSHQIMNAQNPSTLVLNNQVIVQNTDPEILRAYQNLKEDQMVLLHQDSISQSFVNGPLAQLFPQQRQILSRSRMMLLQQMHPQTFQANNGVINDKGQSKNQHIAIKEDNNLKKGKIRKLHYHQVQVKQLRGQQDLSQSNKTFTAKLNTTEDSHNDLNSSIDNKKFKKNILDQNANGADSIEQEDLKPSQYHSKKKRSKSFAKPPNAAGVSLVNFNLRSSKDLTQQQKHQ
ncbi:UNKNOWN [Stylonychia lemnae]|uniref:Uncharacterized protein n=1 Tax=Stylonychia lemnae TaxID=5949 RepID=A0A078A0V4_STYLE|nr:UNKNOWN [Stylonychia lemnae]|eukprot:CDW75765.1 UNKNOWN [Stylonychia lemnae]